MKRTLEICGLALLLAVLASAADLTGTWKGAFEFNGNSVPLTFNLKHSGDTVTGTIEGLPTPNAKIEEGKVAGDALTFSVNIEYEGNPVKLVYKGKIAQDEIQFQFGTEDGAWGTEMTAKRST